MLHGTMGFILNVLKFRLKFIFHLITTFGCISLTVVAALSHGKIHFNLLFESLILHFFFHFWLCFDVSFILRFNMVLLYILYVL